MKRPFYITTTLPYVNAEPHVGFASEILVADVRARFERLAGCEVVFNTGTDEHGQKIYQKALEEGKDPKKYVDEYAEKFSDLRLLLNLSYTHFIRTTDEHHKSAAQELWRRANKNGFIYKKQYRIRYCVGCELEKTDSELDHGECPFHPGKPLQITEEENYYFRWSAFQEPITKLLHGEEQFVFPEKRQNEIRAFVERGLEDFSISRLREKMPWGISVPGDEEHVMYVWFDALTNYVSTLGWPEDVENFEKFWGSAEQPNAVQIAGKDNLRQQSAMWQAMLLSTNLPTSKQIFINGFINAGDGQKMSKSIGNVISPREMVEKFGVDGTRYLLLTKGYFGEDTDISWERMIYKYNADLANGLGNLVSRVMQLRDCDLVISAETSLNLSEDIRLMEMNRALEKIWELVREANKFIEENKPWELKKTNPEQFQTVMQSLGNDIAVIARHLEPFLPETSDRISKMLSGGERENLFQRIL